MSFMSNVDRRSDANQQKGSHVHTMNQREDRKGHSKHQAHQNRKTMEPDMWRQNCLCSLPSKGSLRQSDELGHLEFPLGVMKY